MNGFVYILSNQSMEGLLKIGYTTKPLEERVSELSNTTGIPTNFVVEAFFEVDQPEFFEKQIHKALSKFRIRKQREFFKLSKVDAIRIVKDLCQATPRRNEKIAPQKSPNYKNSQWLAPEKQEFNAIRTGIWKERQLQFEKTFLTDPAVEIPPKSITGKIKRLFMFSEHDMRIFSYDKKRWNACSRIICSMGGVIKPCYGVSKFILSASPYSIARVCISSAADLTPDRIQMILVELQKEEKRIYQWAKENFEKKYQKEIIL